VRTLEALLPVLVLPAGPAVDAAFGQLHDETAFGAPCGPRQVHRAEPAYDPARYWRGPAWPQLSYLLWVAARRHGRTAEAGRLAAATVAGATASGLAEYWHPDTGEGYGAVPQSWTGLAAVMAPTG
jgi:glycogen debranching enzyme